MPCEVWLSIARRLDLRDTATVFALLLVSQQAHRGGLVMLSEWHTREATRKNLTELHRLNTPPHLISAYCLATYYAEHIRKLELNWNTADVSVYRIRADLQLRDAYYWDENGERYRPLCDIPGLEAVAMPATRKELVALYGGTSYRGSSVWEDAALRVSAYNHHKHALGHGPTVDRTPLCNVVLNGVHLFQSCPVHDAILTYKLRTKPDREKIKTLMLRRTREARRELITKRLSAPLEEAKNVTLVQ